MISAPETSWRKIPAVVGSLSAAVLATACNPDAGSGQRTLRFEAEVDLYPLAGDDGNWRREPGVTPPLRQRRKWLVALEKTDAVYVTAPGRAVVFSDLDLEGEVTLGFGLVLPTDGSSRPGAATLEFEARGGRASATWSRVVDTALEEGQLALPILEPVPELAGLRELSIMVNLHPLVEPWVGILRPRAVLSRELVATRGAAPRQVVIITLDTFRADHMGCYGNPDVRTESLDAIARDGVRFESCFSPANATNPAHTSIFTSLHMKDHKVRDNHSLLDPECPTLMQGLAEAGFRTAAFVSAWNFTSERSDFVNRFEHYSCCRDYHERRAEDVNIEALAWMAEHHDEDFFVWIHYFDVHMPYSPPFPYNRLYPTEGEERIELPLLEKFHETLYGASDRLQHYASMYMGEVAYLDDQIGRLVRGLRELEVYDRGLIVVTADHGESLGENGIYCEHTGLFDTTTRVPLLIKPPAGEGARGVVGGLVSTLDVYPTVFDLLELTIDHPVRGRSLLPLVRTGGDSEREAVFSEAAGSHQVSVRTRDYRGMLGLVDRRVFPRFGYEQGRVELYEASRPMLSENDLAAEQSGTSSRVRAVLVEFLAERMSFEAGVIEDEDYARKLEALGYVR